MASKRTRRARRQHRSTGNASTAKSTAQACYTYSPLPTETSIRLLEVLPSSDGEINISLRVFDLKDEPVFDALSYSWANPVTIAEEPLPRGQERTEVVRSITVSQSLLTASGQNPVTLDTTLLSFLSAHPSLPYVEYGNRQDHTHIVNCDGRKISLSKTLFEALACLRWILSRKLDGEGQGMVYLETLPTSRSRYIWIDVICINVPLMNRIFASAQHVFAWVGELDTLSYAAWETIPTICDVYRSGQPWIPGHATFEDRVEKRVQLYTLAMLLSRRWFRRAWVVQEAVYARRLYLWSGPFFLDWWKLLPAIRVFETGARIDDTVTLMGRLIRREPTSLVKMFNRVHSGGVREKVITAAVTDEELFDLVKAAVGFINGVVEMKRSLGLPYYEPREGVQTTSFAGECGSVKENIVSQTAALDSDQDLSLPPVLG
ncbi:uncharacterized protein EI97DRAFT_482149 [Westerdykella ornata]|uniref:Heterokaryon incompatibility domain-containing protein n=1 Tax=Westerdykella ornata TaxID=318751 RepID=A0A6A6JTJ0_WESOR|nr:uncharacterized protein EI97DRAFT_482149 [Westerdykella ornata]KAF2279575.1 hypothetical protein EI97DRAFT_482149 [Westerdykella ornata]